MKTKEIMKLVEAEGWYEVSKVEIMVNINIRLKKDWLQIPVHRYDAENTFCAKCAKKHAKTCVDFDDYAAMPIVNSPRMGVCGYEGGTIDKKRDRVFIKNKKQS
jgi:hypothetical protein